MPAPTRFHVDLDALHHNLGVARRLAGGRQVLAPVKANAYGHGLVEVARSIQERGTAEWLGIAVTAEGAQLRAAGVTLPILKFSPTLPEDLDEAIAALVSQSLTHTLTLQRLKKQKLSLKDAITRIEDQLIPDIIA